jgi:hypothetical protein
VTDAEWNTCINPDRMLSFVEQKASSRKARLVSVACCCRIWSVLRDSGSQMAIEVAEKYADGAATLSELEAAGVEAAEAWDGQPDDVIWAAAACIKVTESDAIAGAIEAGRCVAASFADTRWRDAVDAAANTGIRVMEEPPKHSKALTERQQQSNLLRCIFGNPFRPLTLTSFLLTDSVLAIARGIYEERAFERMPVLADALEDSGVADEALLAHCRSTGPHARGCHVLDLILGKE